MNYEQDEIMNLKFPSMQAEEIQTTKLQRASGPNSISPSRSMDSKKMDYHRRSVRSYLQDGQTGLFRTLE